jgi:hypothetical protein
VLRYAVLVVGVRVLSPWVRGRRVVQQESTATGLDAGGPEWTREDGDLHRDTWMDGLPLDGMQEVWGSNPHSSTGQKRNSKSPAESTAAKYRNGDRISCRTPVRTGHLTWLRLLARSAIFRS